MSVPIKTTANNMCRTWNVLRPTVESRKAFAKAQTFDNLIARVEAANSFNQYQHLAIDVLNQVDNLEKVFTH